MCFKWMKPVLKLTSLLIIAISLSSCDNTSVYGSVGVGSSGFNSHSSGRRMHGSISVGGRIR
jgi:hypothetical protein